MTYRAPVKDMLFVMKELAGIDAVAQLPGHEDAGYDTAAAVLEECARFNEGVLAPLNAEGDKAPSSFHDGRVTTTPGFKEAYRRALQFTGKVGVLVGVTLAAGVVTWAFSPIKFQADMGILLAFMFVWNMVGAVILIPALSHFLLPSGSQSKGVVPAHGLPAAA